MWDQNLSFKTNVDYRTTGTNDRKKTHLFDKYTGLPVFV